MSDDPNAEAPPTAPAPSLVVAKVGDGSFIAHLHIADKLRTVFGRNLPEIGRRLVSSAIGEFGMKQEDAQALVDNHGLAAMPTAQEHSDVQAELAAVKAHLAEVLAANEKLQAHIAELTTPPPPPPTDAQVGGVSGLPSIAGDAAAANDAQPAKEA